MGAEIAALVLDAVLVTTAVALGWRCVLTGDRFESVVLFVGLGVVMSIAWTRLDAPDLALAEAALGAGLTGALLLAAWAETRHLDQVDARGAFAVPAVVATAAMALAAVGLAPLIDRQAGLAAEATARIAQTGVTHPVTAVLVDYRAFDTLLELCVLLAALAGTWQLGAARALLHGRLRGPVFTAYARIVLPVLVVLAGALL